MVGSLRYPVPKIRFPVSGGFMEKAIERLEIPVDEHARFE